MLLQGSFVFRGTLALAFALLAACQTAPEVRTNTAPTANLSSYATYGFELQPGNYRGGNPTPLNAYFEAAIAREMEARGYIRVDGDPNLLVSINANVQDRAGVDATPGALTSSYYGNRAGLSSGPEVQTVSYKVGTASIDMIDASQNRIVWQGSAEGILNDAKNNPQSAVNQAVTRMFAQFPGRAASLHSAESGAPNPSP